MTGKPKAKKKTKTDSEVVTVSDEAAALLNKFTVNLLAFNASMDAKVIDGQKKAEADFEAASYRLIKYLSDLEKNKVDPTFDRKGFEAWAEAQHYDLTLATGEGGWDKAGEYKERAVRHAWGGWRAAKGYVAPVTKVDMAKVVVTVEHEEEGDGDWSNDMFTIYLNGEKFAYCNGFLEYDSKSKKKIPFNWDIFSTSDYLTKTIARKIDFSGLNDISTRKQAMTFMRKQVKAWLKTPAAKKVVEHFFQWKDTGTYATRLRSA